MVQGRGGGLFELGIEGVPKSSRSLTAREMPLKERPVFISSLFLENADDV